MPGARRFPGPAGCTGWHTVRYDDLINGMYLYNRCHLIGYQLSGENANEENLITGTRYMNVEGMLPFEDMVADYVHETDNHVMYRVTPVFEGDDLVASGVQMEAESVEDDGEGIKASVLPKMFDGRMEAENPAGSDAKRNMGIGLSVCMTIVKAHKGSMKAENREEGGARVMFWLPKGMESENGN